MYWTTLGAARYRNEFYEEAIQALDAQLRSEGDPSWGAFFVAMAKCQLGDHSKALELYRRAVSQTEQLMRGAHSRDPANEELRRFRAEAALLLATENRQPGQRSGE